jgi:molybdenum cofactor synthesis domain-containing protein
MRPFDSIISLTEARRRLDASVRPIARTERVPIADAAGRVAAADITSPLDVPPFSRATMDGYAVIAADTADASDTSPRRLRILERVYTGRPAETTIVRGTCAEIATGAPIPAGADAVVMVEQTSLASNDEVNLRVPAAPNQNVGRRGSDIAAGEVAVRAGELLTPGRVGAAAAIGRTTVEVYAQPRVAILSTGDEVVPPGGELTPGQVFDVNRFTLSALVSANGGTPDPREPAGDTLRELTEALDAVADADIVVFSGGSSVGERDLLADAVAARGGVMVFHGVAVKPGKPMALALLGGMPFFGMPGNPTSCLSNAYIFLLPFLRATARLPPHEPQAVRVPLGQRVASQPGRHQFYTVQLIDGVAYPAFKGSGDITSLSRADGYFEIPAEATAIDQGTTVEVKLF